MSSKSVKEELIANQAIRNEIIRRIKIIKYQIESIGSGESIDYVVYVPHQNDSGYTSYLSTSSRSKELVRKLKQLILQLKKVKSEHKRILIKRKRIWTKGEITKFYGRIKLIEKKLMHNPDYLDDEKLEELHTQTNEIIGSLITIIDQEPSRQNMKLLLNFFEPTLGILGDTDGYIKGMEALENAGEKRLRNAINLYEINPNKYFTKLLRETSLYQNFSSQSHPLFNQAERIISRRLKRRLNRRVRRNSQ